MAIIELTINVENAAHVAILYDQLHVFRSPDETGDPTPFVQLTDSEPTPAVVDGTIAEPWNLNGQSLSIILDGAPSVLVSFSGTNPFTLLSVLEAINSVVSIASEVPTDTDKLRLTSPTVGTQSILQVSGTALTTLGLSTIKVNGKTAAPLLSPNTEFYRLIDFDTETTYWYKVRYQNSETGAVSDFSTPFLGGEGQGLPDSVLSIGKIALCDLSGRPLIGRRIIFVPVSSQLVLDGLGHNYGILPSVDRIVVQTDMNGRATISLAIGQLVKVFIEGTTFQREFVVPPADFDILTVASTQPDPLSIVVAPPIPIRVS
jgi:hypothetical protein